MASTELSSSNWQRFSASRRASSAARRARRSARPASSRLATSTRRSSSPCGRASWAPSIKASVMASELLSATSWMNGMSRDWRRKVASASPGSRHSLVGAAISRSQLCWRVSARSSGEVSRCTRVAWPALRNRLTRRSASFCESSRISRRMVFFSMAMESSVRVRAGAKRRRMEVSGQSTETSRASQNLPPPQAAGPLAL